MNVKNKSLLLESNDLGPEMARSLEMVHDFGANEMPNEENEGISPAPKGFSDSVGLDIAGDAQINSVYLAGNANVEQAPKSSENANFEELLSMFMKIKETGNSSYINFIYKFVIFKKQKSRIHTNNILELNSAKPDFILGTETCLDNNLSSFEYFPTDIYRTDRPSSKNNQSYGGVLLAVTKEFVSTEIQELEIHVKIFM
ncbi:uncharacterized protein LOC127733696 [Mytilus californianus]|uniref:uncharacterized protein LOC127733696 n=1 Tax=Mytilus californianus TaxID=6549 RepID=UPI0022482202|nr:uncharacterized protein LOC127733696 [Mytilus californianus]